MTLYGFSRPQRFCFKNACLIHLEGFFKSRKKSSTSPYTKCQKGGVSLRAVFCPSSDLDEIRYVQTRPYVVPILKFRSNRAPKLDFTTAGSWVLRELGKIRYCPRK